MAYTKELDKFLAKNKISDELFKNAEIDWKTLTDIAEDHEEQIDALEETAGSIARRIQKFPHVHSVRWRIKETDHLLEKIIRKLNENKSSECKYKNINAENYFEIVQDLVGVRALHLFKSNVFEIDEKIRATWTLEENAKAYIRKGDDPQIIELFKNKNFMTREHAAGYRSIHYIVGSTPTKRKVFTEIQLRTIFEEGWSEIDHAVRYPNFSKNQLLEYFLQIFNRLAGNADEMGSFVIQLAREIEEKTKQVEDSTNERNQILEDLANTIDKFEKLQTTDAASKELIKELQRKVNDLSTQIQTISTFGHHGKLGLGAIYNNKTMPELGGTQFKPWFPGQGTVLSSGLDFTSIIPVSSETSLATLIQEQGVVTSPKK